MTAFKHLILIDEIIAEIDAYRLQPEERDELVELTRQTVNQHILTTVLDLLPRDRHDHFVARYPDSADEKLLEWLKSEIAGDIEAKIKQAATKIKKEILAEIKKAKRK